MQFTSEIESMMSLSDEFNDIKIIENAKLFKIWS